MFFITNPYLMLAKRGGSLPIFQGDEGSSEVDLTDSDGDGIPDNAVIEHGSAYWTDENGNIQMANVDNDGNWEIASNDEGQGGGTTDPATGLTFSQAYRQARDAGERTFTWNGKEYTTRSESESEEDFEKKFEEKEEGEEGKTDIDEGIDDKTIDENDELTDLEKAQLKAEQADLGFRDPDQATILSGIGDNPFLELADAVERGVKSFGADEYYDPGSKEDYMKYTVRNVSDQDMVYDPEDRLKAMYNPKKYLKTNKEFEDEIIEEGMMDFYKQRRKDGAGGKDMYGRVKDFDADQFRETGVGATYGRKGPGFGDELEQKYQDASYLGFTTSESGNVLPYNYLQDIPGSGDPNYIGPQGDVTIPGYEGSLLSRDFEGSSTPFDSSDDSMEWKRSLANPRNQLITMPTIPVTEIPLNNSEPELQEAIPYIPMEPVDTPVDPNTPGVEDLEDIPPNLARYGGGLPRYQNKGQVNEEDVMIGPDGKPYNIMLPEVQLIEKDPNWWRRNKRKISNWGHGILDAAGIIPGFGEVFDGLNALWYAAEGDKVNAALSAAAMIPFGGMAPTIGKYANKAYKGIKGSKGGKRTIDEGMEYAAKYVNDPDYLRHMNTEKVRIAKDLNNAKLNFDMNKPTANNLFQTNVPSIHDKINSRVSFADITNPNKPLMLGPNELYRNPFLFKKRGDLNLGIGDFRNTYDDLLADAQMSGFRDMTKVLDDVRTSSGIFYHPHIFAGKYPGHFSSMSSARTAFNPFPDGRFYVKNADGSVGVHEYSHFLDAGGLNFSNKQTSDLLGLRRTDASMLNWKNKGPAHLDSYNYYTKPTEIKARMMEMRFKEGLMPGDMFTMDMLKKYTQPSLLNRMSGTLFPQRSKNMFGMQKYLNLSTPAAQQNFLNIMNKYKKDGGSLFEAQYGWGDLWDDIKGAGKFVSNMSPTGIITNTVKDVKADYDAGNITSFDDLKTSGVNSYLDNTQQGLQGAGFIPGWGIAADVANAGISKTRAHFEDDPVKKAEYNIDAATNLVSAVPIVGDSVAAAATLDTVTGGNVKNQMAQNLVDNANTTSTTNETFITESKETPVVEEEYEYIPQSQRTGRYGGSLPKAQQLGEFNNPTLGLTVPSLSGYSLSGNQASPFTTSGPTLFNPTGLLNTSVIGTPTSEDQYKSMTDADMYASSQAVQRSMDSFDAFTADMNKRIENPSLSMNQVDTNPLNLPETDFSPSPELQKTLDVMDYTIAENQGRLMGTGFDATIVPSAEDMQQQSEEFSANLDEQMSNIPEYQGTQENLDRFEESNERGFDGDLAAMDEFDAQQEQEQADADLARAQIDLASERPGFGTRAYNTLLRAADSKAAQTYSKFSNMAIDISKPITKIAADVNARKQKENMMNNAYLADNLFASTNADTSGNKGNYDPNTGIFRPDDKVIVGTTGSARFGGQFYKSGGAIDIDMNTYKQLVAAGADITIL